MELIGAPRQVFPRYPGGLQASKRRGVYVIYDRRGRVAHVGRTPKAKDGIAQRLRDHMHGQSSFAVHHLKNDGSRLWRENFEFRSIAVPSGRYRALLEAYAIGRLCPIHLGLGLKDR